MSVTRPKAPRPVPGTGRVRSGRVLRPRTARSRGGWWRFRPSPGVRHRTC